jgi:hypothetical protein
LCGALELRPLGPFGALELGPLGPLGPLELRLLRTLLFALGAELLTLRAELFALLLPRFAAAVTAAPLATLLRDRHGGGQDGRTDQRGQNKLFHLGPPLRQSAGVQNNPLMHRVG